MSNGRKARKDLEYIQGYVDTALGKTPTQDKDVDYLRGYVDAVITGTRQSEEEFSSHINNLHSLLRHLKLEWILTK